MKFLETVAACSSDSANWAGAIVAVAIIGLFAFLIWKLVD